MINSIKFFFAYFAILNRETPLIFLYMKLLKCLIEILKFYLFFFIFLSLYFMLLLFFFFFFFFFIGNNNELYWIRN